MTKAQKENIAVIGTGNYGIAIGKRLVQFGYEVVFGSREPNPKYVQECFGDDLNGKSSTPQVTSIEEAFKTSHKLIFLALTGRREVYEFVLDEIVSLKELSTRILIDVSNWTESNQKRSNAEQLEEVLAKRNIKTFKVLKAFNSINAYTMGSGFYDQKGGQETVQIAGDCQESKDYLSKFCNRIGFNAVDAGPLSSAFKMEQSNQETFKEWQSPSFVSLLFLLFNFVWIFIHYFIFPKKAVSFAKYLDDFSLLSHTNKVLGYTSLQLLAMVYLANVFASIYQLKWNTKYKRFPRWLDYWLRTRKQYGLWAFLISSFHALATIFIVNPSYLPDWYIANKLNKFNLSQMTLNGELNILTGILTFILMLLVALSSINSIANSLNWSEWRFVQTDLGLGCLFVGFLHASFMYMRIYLEKDEKQHDLVYLLTRVKLIATYLPLVTLLFRFIFGYFKPISQRLEAIRNGSSLVNTNGNKSE